MTRTIAYVSPFVPAEWIAAHGLCPLRLLPDRPPAAIPQGACPFAAAFAGCASGVNGFDGLVVAPTCDQMRRVSQRVAEARRDVFVMHVPACWQSEEAPTAYLAELRRLGQFLAQLGGTPPTDAHLAEVMRMHDDARAAAAQRHSARERRGIPVALIGGPILRADRFVYDTIARCGGRVVLDATETGSRCRPPRFHPDRLGDAPLSELARAYFEIPDVFRRPNDPLHEYVRREMAVRGVRGVVLARYVWCDLWHAEFARLRQWIDCPVVEIDLAGGDRDGAGQRVGTRIESLLESLR